MLENCIENVRKSVPLVHNITNYVTVNDVANVLLACGGSPIMSDEPEDVKEITSICQGLNINIGTLNKRTIEGMLAAGARANELGHVTLLDPVGAGASGLRTNTAVELMEKVRFDVIRGNISEVKTLAQGSGTTKGVDADVADAVTEENLEEGIAFAKAFAKKAGCFDKLPVLEPRIREILLKWLSDAMESADFSARTDDGRRYILDRSQAGENCVVHCEDGNFTMPKLFIVFQEEE